MCLLLTLLIDQTSKKLKKNRMVNSSSLGTHRVSPSTSSQCRVSGQDFLLRTTDREIKIRLMNEGRGDERLKDRDEEST